MKTVKTISHILFPLFLGLIIGGAIMGNTAAWVIGIILLVVDIVVGIALQYCLNRTLSDDNWNNLSFDEKRKIAHDSTEKAMQDMRDEGIDVDNELENFCNDFNRQHKLGTYKQSENKKKEFIVSGQEIEQLVDLFNEDIICVNEIIQKMSWDDEKAKNFVDFLLLAGYLDIMDNDLFEADPNSLIINEDYIQELIDELPIEIDENHFNREWRNKCCDTLKEVVEEIARKNPSFNKKDKYTLDDIDILIGMSFCCITYKPEDLCKKVQNTIRERARNNPKFNGTKKEFDLSEIKSLLNMTFAHFNVQEDV